jgi:hypothetical protein
MGVTSHALSGTLTIDTNVMYLRYGTDTPPLYAYTSVLDPNEHLKRVRNNPDLADVYGFRFVEKHTRDARANGKRYRDASYLNHGPIHFVDTQSDPMTADDLAAQIGETAPPVVKMRTVPGSRMIYDRFNERRTLLTGDYWHRKV